MKVVICSHDYPYYVSGPNVWLLRILQELKKLSIEITVLFTRGGEGNEYGYIRSVREIGVPCKVYNGLNYTEKKIHWILRILQDESPDIFLPNIDVPALYAARWVKESGIPTIGVLRSDEKLYMAILDSFVDQSGPFRLDSLVCVSKYLEEVAQKHNRHNIVIRRIPSGTPIPDKIAQKEKENLKLIYMGRLTEKAKRISEITSILCQTVREVKGTEAIIYGTGEAISSVLEIIRKDGDGLPIRHGGVLQSDEVQEKLLEGQVFVLLSDYEGLPTSLMEAMACGLVPICLDIRSGIPELVEHDKTGLLVKNRGDDFIRAVNRLKHENGLWERLSAGAREKIEKEYNAQKSVHQWKELFIDLLKSNKLSKQTIKIPPKIDLPEPHKYFIGADPRYPGLINHLFKVTKLRASYLARNLRLI
jgi:colanic acid/amylovoran biosynthesis glycosyltransferase